jgi:hypothetical protein
MSSQNIFYPELGLWIWISWYYSSFPVEASYGCIHLEYKKSSFIRKGEQEGYIAKSEARQRESRQQGESNCKPY